MAQLARTIEEKLNQENTLLEVNTSKNMLEVLFDHFFKEAHGNPIPFGKVEKIHLTFEFIGATAGIYSWPPAWAYGQGRSNFIKYSVVISNPLSNVLFLMKATDDMLMLINAELSVPNGLEEVLTPTKTKDLCERYTKMLLGSIVCSIPFALTTYFFPLPSCEEPPCIDITIGHSLLTNMILHAVSWNVILTPELWYYRIPFLPFEKLYHCIKKCWNSNKQKADLENKQIVQMISHKYKNHLANLFTKTSELFIEIYLNEPEQALATIHLKSIESKEFSLIHFVNTLKRERVSSEARRSFSGSITARSTSGRLSRLSSSLAQPQRKSCIKIFFKKLDNCISIYIISPLGATFMMIGCSGWIASPIYLLNHHVGLSITASIFLGFLPAYSTAVLCAFYGSATFQQIYRYLTTWDKGLKNKIPIMARYYPKTFLTLLAINGYISYFSYSTAQQLIATIFSSSFWDLCRPILVTIASPALQMLSFVPLLGLINTGINGIVAKFGNPEHDLTRIARLSLKSNTQNLYLQRVPGPLLLENLSEYPEPQQKILDINSFELKQDMDTVARLVSEVTPIKENKSKNILAFSPSAKKIVHVPKEKTNTNVSNDLTEPFLNSANDADLKKGWCGIL